MESDSSDVESSEDNPSKKQTASSSSIVKSGVDKPSTSEAQQASANEPPKITKEPTLDFESIFKEKKPHKWDPKNTNFRDVYLAEIEEIKKTPNFRPAMKVLGWIPKQAFTHWQYNPVDRHYYPYGLNLEAFDVQEISILKAFPFLRYLNLTSNRLRTPMMHVFKDLPNLTSLILDNNRVHSLDIPGLNLRHLTLRKNRIVWADPFSMPKLEYVALDKNRCKFLENFDNDSTPNLITLSFTENRLRMTKSDLPNNLQYLYLGKNKIRRLESLEVLVNLRKLHLRGNRIKKLNGFTWHLQNLRYLNLRDNKITSVRQVKKLTVLPKLEVLITTGNAFEEARDEESNRAAMVYAVRRLKRINKKEVTKAELDNCETAGRPLIDNDAESSDDAIPEDSEDEEEGPPADWEEDDDPESDRFNPLRMAEGSARLPPSSS